VNTVFARASVALMLCALTAFVGTAHSDPPPSIQYLMAELATMFDHGMDQIRDVLKQIRVDYLLKDRGKVYVGMKPMTSLQFTEDLKIVSAFPEYDSRATDSASRCSQNFRTKKTDPRLNFAIPVHRR